MKEKIYNIVKRIQAVLMSETSFHLIYSLVLCTVMAIVVPIHAAVILTLGIGITKEAVDKYTYGLWSWSDLAADAAGVILAAVIHLV